MHYYQFNIGDYAKNTAHLSLFEDLAYRRLIDLYYDTEKPIPLDLKHVSRLLRMREHEEEIRIVLQEFFIETSRGWKNKTCDENIKNYKDFLRKQSDNGKKGGRPRKQRAVEDKEQTHRKPTVNPKESQKKPNQEPLTNNHKLETTNQDYDASKPKRKHRIPEDFELTENMAKKAQRYWIDKNRPDLSTKEEFDKFHNHHLAAGTVLLDWERGWQTWYTNAIAFTKPVYGGSANDQPLFD